MSRFSLCNENIVIGAAPLGSARQLPAVFGVGSRRLRRRGPRSQLSNLRRSVPRHRRTLPDMRPGESGLFVSESIFSSVPPTTQLTNKSDDKENSNLPGKSACNYPVRSVKTVNDVCIYFVNIRCLLAKANFEELCLQLEVHRPHVVCIQETWLNSTTKAIVIPGYEEVSRRDRSPLENRGGILTLRRDDFNCLVHISNTPTEERSWHFLKVGVDTILLANWYRPGSSASDEFSTLYA